MQNNESGGRLAFVEQRDGKEGAIAFAKQTKFLYHKALAQRNTHHKRGGYGLVYRQELVESCIVFREYLKNNP